MAKKLWKVSQDGNDIEDANGCGICALYADESAEDNAALIVKAVNCHDGLLEALKTLEYLARRSGAFVENAPALAQARAVIAKAEGKG
jgi:hypothetical protein